MDKVKVNEHSLTVSDSKRYFTKWSIMRSVDYSELHVGLFRYKDTMRTVETPYGKNTTKWKTSLATTWAEAEAEAGGGAAFVGLPVQRTPPG